KMNCIMKCGKNFMVISDRIEANRHRHWLLQLFLASQTELNIEVDRRRIPCRAILVNTNVEHMFTPNGEPNFTIHDKHGPHHRGKGRLPCSSDFPGPKMNPFCETMSGSISTTARPTSPPVTG